MRAPNNIFAMQGSDWYDVLMYYVGAEESQQLAAFAKQFGFEYQFEG
jgi:hypothetical protein